MKAVIACAHKILRLIYKLFSTHQIYQKEKVLGLGQQFSHLNFKKFNYSIAQGVILCAFLLFFSNKRVRTTLLEKLI